MQRKGSFVPAFLAVFLLIGGIARSQTTTAGSLTVRVTDSSGASVPEAQLEVKDLSTNVTSRAVTNESGAHSFPNLPFGTYQLSITAKGFQNQVFESVQVQTARDTVVTAVLKVGATTETVTVTTNEAPLVEPGASTIANTIDTKQVVSLPLQGRAMYALAFLTPGWTSDRPVSSPGSSAGTFNNMPGGAIVSADYDGTQAISNRFRSGGYTYGTSVVQPRIENIAEMTVQTAQVDLSGNGTSAMKIALVTRRGSNAFHGRIFEDFQNTALNANSWLNNARRLPRNVVKLNDFGFSIGGPILRNKLFFFGTYAQSKEPRTVAATASVLSASAQRGIFEYRAANGSTQSIDVLGIGATAGGPGAVNANIAGQLQAINGVLGEGTITPTADPNLSTLAWQYGARRTVHYPALRFDYNISDSLRLNVSYTQQKTIAPGNYAPIFPGGIDTINRTSANSNNKIAGFGLDYTIRPTLINQFRAGFMYQYSIFSPENLGLDLTTVFPQAWAYGTSLLNSGVYPRQAVSSLYPMFSWSDSMNWQRGGHSFVFGGGWYREQDHYWNGPGGYPISTLGLSANDPLTPVFTSRLVAAGLSQAQQTAAQNLYATLVGRVRLVNIGGGGRPLDPSTGQYKPFGAYNLNEVQQAGHVFAQDKWRLTPTLTLNFGLRWDLIADAYDKSGAYSSPASLGDFWGPTPVGAIFQPGTLGGVTDPKFTVKKHAYNSTWRNFSPALALAWAPQAKGLLGRILPAGKTVIRAGWSLRFYQEGAQNFWAFASNQGTFFFQQGSLQPDITGAVGTFQPGSLSLGQPLPPYALFPSAWSRTIPASTLTFNSAFFAMNPNIRQPYVEQWNFGIQREVGRDSAIEVRYVGNLSMRSWFSVNLNETNTLENGFVREFQNAQGNLAINQANGRGNSFQNNGLPGQVALPIFAAAFGTTTGTLYNQFLNQFQTGAAGSVANTLANTQSNICNMYGAKFSPCAALGLGGAGTSYPINFFQVNPFTAGRALNYLDAIGKANYHSMQAEFRQRLNRGMQFSLNYTLGKSLVLGPVNGYQANAGGSFLTNRNHRLSYRPSPFDVRHVFRASGTYDLPFGKGRRFLNGSRLSDSIAGGWTLGTIIQMQSGNPAQLTGGFNTVNNSDSGVIMGPGVTARTIQDAVGVHRTGNPWVLTLDPSLVAANGAINPSIYGPNNIPGVWGVNSFIYGPGWFNADLSVNKVIPIRESVRATLQGQFLNVFNHPAFGLGALGAQSLSYGQSTSLITAARRIEIRVNIEF